MATWVYPDNLSLKETIASKWVDNEEKIVEVVTMGMAPEVYKAMEGNHCYPTPNVKTNLHPSQQHLLGYTFAKYLTVDELKQIITHKEGARAKNQ